MDTHIRVASAADAQAIAQVHVRSWRFGHHGLFPQSVIDSITVEEREASWAELLTGRRSDRTILLAEREGEVVGFTSSGPGRGSLAGGTAEIYEFFVDPEAVGKGVGLALLKETLDRLDEAGFRIVTLWVTEGNERARRFYERQGFRPDGAIKTATMGSTESIEMRYRMRVA